MGEIAERKLEDQEPQDWDFHEDGMWLGDNFRFGKDFIDDFKKLIDKGDLNGKLQNRNDRRRKE